MKAPLLLTVDESELLHHEELAVPAGLEEGYAHAAQVLHLDAAEAVDDVGLADHLVEPVLDRRVAVPPALGVPDMESRRTVATDQK